MDPEIVQCSSSTPWQSNPPVAKTRELEGRFTVVAIAKAITPGPLELMACSS
jgi:hypothetical protein